MTALTNPIRGKIAKILNDREVVLNVGANRSVRPGMTFDIVFEVDVDDPDTGEALGSVESPKTRVKVSRVYDKVAIASTYRTRRVNVGGRGLGLASGLFDPPRWETRPETLRVKESVGDGRDESDAPESYVSVGDPVVQVTDTQDPG